MGSNSSKTNKATQQAAKAAPKGASSASSPPQNPILDGLLPPTILDGSGKDVATKTLAGKFLAFYFGAKWCASCAGFTPTLIQWFKSFKANHPKKDQFEIVLASSDRTQEQFDEYSRYCGFYALPFQYRKERTLLATRLGVHSLPMLVVVDPNGQVVTTEGRKLVSEDAEAAAFPWTPIPVASVIGDGFKTISGQKLTLADLAGKYIGFYFSAQWCPKCRMLTPLIKNMYQSLKAAGKPFEIVYVSSDHSQDQFDEYFATMPWISLDEDLSDTTRRQALGERLKVKGLPTLAVVAPDLSIVTFEARPAIEADPSGADFPWYPKPYLPLNEANYKLVNTNAVCLINTGGNVGKATSALEAAARAELAVPAHKLKFMYVESDKVFKLIAQAAQIKSAEKLVIVDLPRTRKYVCADQSLTSQSVSLFVSEFFEGVLEPIELDPERM